MSHYDDLYEEVTCTKCENNIQRYTSSTIMLGNDEILKYKELINQSSKHMCKKCYFEMLEEYAKNNTVECKDKLGNDIMVGNEVAYADEYSLHIGYVLGVVDGFVKLGSKYYYSSSVVRVLEK